MGLKVILKSTRQALCIFVPITFLLWILLAMGIQIFPMEFLFGYGPIAFFIFIVLQVMTLNWK